MSGGPGSPIHPPGRGGYHRPVEVSPPSSPRPTRTAAPPRPEAPELSVVLPVFDERDNLPALYREIREALEGRDWELVIVDDGSRDGSEEIALRLAAGDGRVRVLSYGENRGQTAAMLAGIRGARAPLVATMDADGQNDPADLPALLAALGSHDAVVGMRTKRRDGFVRRASSRIANRVRNALTGDTITDTGCSLKLFRRGPALEVPAFRGMHRFLPTLLRLAGHSVIEVPVNHRPRRSGASKYGIRNRLVPATLDLLAVCWMRRRWIDVRAHEVRPGPAELAAGAPPAEPVSAEEHRAPAARP